jgi:hypothetical protein
MTHEAFSLLSIDSDPIYSRAIVERIRRDRETVSASVRDVEGDVGAKGLLTEPPTEPNLLLHRQRNHAADGITNGPNYQTRRSHSLSRQQLFLMS